MWDDAHAKARVQLRKLTRRFDVRPQRERVAMLVAMAALAFWLADKLWVTPAFVQSRAASARLATAQAELTTLRAQSTQLQTLGLEQERQLKAELAQWRQRVDQEAAALRDYESTLVRADRMVELLEQMLPRHGRIKVRELRSLPRTDLMAASAAAGAVPQPAASASAPKAPPGSAPALYRHGVELTLEGGWTDLFEYLQALETMPRRVLWGGMALKVEQHPKVVLTLRLYTLSLDGGWLEI
jgi:MSHA biogenesis protein MshJ